jgi:hypothetical protein
MSDTSRQFKKTVLIIPPNDAEAILISQLARKMGLPMILSHQTHGASLDKGRDYLPEVKQVGYSRVVVVEMPGPKTEARFRKLGVELVIIDHHHYTGLDRAHDPKTGRMLKSSLEHFLTFFKLTDAKLHSFGFDPKLVRAIGVMDRGFIWALREEGWSKKEIDQVLAFHDELLSKIHNPKTEKRKNDLALRVWKKRKKWNGYYVVETRADIQLRPRLSRIVALEIGRPTSLIVIERGRGLIYVQESDHAMDLFQHFGGFTFGLDRNWGYRNEPGNQRVTLRNVKKRLQGK